MAVIVNNQDKDEQQQPGVQGVSPVTGGAPAGPAAPVTSAAPKQVGSGQFTNVQKYLQANQGSGQKIAGEIANKGTQTAQATGNTIQQTQGAIGGQMQAENARIADAGGIKTQVQNDPTKLIQNDTIDPRFAQLYAGTNAADTIRANATQQMGNAQSQLTDLQNYANNAGTEQGRFDLLRQSLGRPTYTQGQQKLDQLLVQSGGGNILSDLQKNLAGQATTQANNYTNLGNTIQTGLKGITDQSAAAQADLKATLGGLDPNDPGTGNPTAGTGELGKLQQTLANQAKDYRTTQQGLQDQLTQGISTGNFNADMLNRLGLTPGMKTYGLNLGDYLQGSFAPGTVTEQSQATPEQVARYQALAKLAGTDSTYLNPQNNIAAQGFKVNDENLQQFKNSQQQLAGRESTLAEKGYGSDPNSILFNAMKSASPSADDATLREALNQAGLEGYQPGQQLNSGQLARITSVLANAGGPAGRGIYGNARGALQNIVPQFNRELQEYQTLSGSNRIGAVNPDGTTSTGKNDGSQTVGKF